MNMGSLKILPLLIIVSVLAFSVRLTEVVTGISTVSGVAFAEEKAIDNGGDDKKSDDDGGGDIKDSQQIIEGETPDMPEWRDANYSDLDGSDIKMELFEDLSERRRLLEEGERGLTVREALLKATEKEIERKFQELSKLRTEIEKLLDRQSDEENKRILSLVKIYEGMKPKDSARIFDTLDIDVLVSVISKMSERKVAPVMAAMNPERARTITIMLAEQKTLPILR